MKKFLPFFGILGLAIIMISQGLAASEAHWGSRGWLQFPSNDFSPVHDPGIDMTSSAQLALTAKGPNIAMTYTVATYELKALPDREMMEIQIFDADLNPGLGHDQGSEVTMELVFESNTDGNWWVECWSETQQNYVKVADPVSSRIQIGHEGSSCSFPKQEWSKSIRIYPGNGSSLNMKTVWLDSTADRLYSDKLEHYQDLLNVFRLQSRFGVIRLAATNPGTVSFNNGTPISFRSYIDKSIYEQSLNWAVLYKTEMKTFFSFEIDVSNIQSNYLLLWDKDADANKLFTDKGKQAASPPDAGLKMMVRWSDGSPLEYDRIEDTLNGGIPITNDPEWTHFDQTNRPDFLPSWHIPGETNHFDGPSWDSAQDPEGHDALRWYRIPLHERKSNTVLVGWYGSTMPLNTFAFAASGPVAPAPCSDPAFCREVFELPAEEDVIVCPESGHEDCVNDLSTNFTLKIDSDPPPETSELIQKKVKSLKYYLKIENKKNEVLSDLSIVFSPPLGTVLHPDQVSLFDNEGRMPLEDIPEFSSKDIALEVLLKDTAIDQEVISTKDRVFFEQFNTRPVSPSVVRHYPGLGIDEEPGCSIEGDIKLCINSYPAADPAEESFGLDPSKADKNKITYIFSVENLSDNVGFENLQLNFEPPLYTTLHEDFINSSLTHSGEQYTGKGEAVFKMKELLLPGDRDELSFAVQLDEVVDMTDYDISSAGRFQLLVDNYPQVEAPELVHHVGKGGVNIEATRCYAFDYFGGEFSCSDMCQDVEPGSRITVRDSLKNVGGSLARDYEYFPLPLSSAFEYDPNSVRIDDPETGLSISNDGESFPPQGGIQILGPLLSGQAREVYFSYTVPYGITEEQDDQNGCFPKTDEVIQTFPPDANSPELLYDQECTLAQRNQVNEPGNICVSVEEAPRLTAKLTSLPLAGSTVYQGSHITYFLEISNQSLQAVAELKIQKQQPQQTECVAGFCVDISLQEPLALSQKFGTHYEDLFVKVNDDAQGEIIQHNGYIIRYQGADGDELQVHTNSIEHALITAPEPVGEFRHDIRLSRRTALNTADRERPRSDGGDRIEIEHEFTYEGRQYSPVWPEMSGYRNHRKNVCSWQFPSYEHYDASFNANSIVYNSTQRHSSLRSFDQIRSADVDFQITTLVPSERPELLVDPGENDYQDQFEYRFSGSDRSSRGLNGFMNGGGTISSSELENTSLRAVKDGVAGKIETSNTALTTQGSGFVSEDYWLYAMTGYRMDWWRCTRCTGNGCYRYPAYVPIYKWKLTSSNPIPMLAHDQDYVTVLTSVAWLQTKNGHVGFGSPLWETGPNTGDPNWVDLGDKLIPSAMKWHTPPNESNADLLVLHTGAQDPVQSGLGASGRVGRENSQGFIDSPLEGVGRQLARGDAYDREENPREYLDDLLNRQLYGQVVRLNQATELPPGLSRNGSEFQIEGSLFLENDTIYHLKGELRIGKVGGQPVSLSSGRARLLVDGSAQILSNVEYASSDASELSQVTSVRLHTLEDIQIHPSVTDVELMMLAESRFSSGKSDKQLRILGDVIAQTVAWERRPLNNPRESDEEVNKPSEIIYEDFRKYLVAPPGDRKLAE
jgi:hypothetical protein